MPRVIRYCFTDIPFETQFRVWEGSDEAHSEVVPASPNPAHTHSIDVEIPDAWTTPRHRVRAMPDYIVAALNGNKGEIPAGANKFDITGDDYYSDVGRPDRPENLNQKAVETLVYQVAAPGHLNGRQKFYSALLALESYMEFLTYGILVMSGRSTANAYAGRGARANLIRSFRDDPANPGTPDAHQFFAADIELRPGLVQPLRSYTAQERADLQLLFDRVRDLRNAVAHSWGAHHIDRADLITRFRDMNQNLSDFGQPDEEFYSSAAELFTRIYAFVHGAVGNQVSLFKERWLIRQERAVRGY